MPPLLPLLLALCAVPVRGIFDRTCPRKEPPPGVLVLAPNSKLVLTCSGDVKVNGAKVRMWKNSSNTSKGLNSSDATPTTDGINNTAALSDRLTMKNAVSEGPLFEPTGMENKRVLKHMDSGYTASPTTHSVQKSSISWSRKNGSKMDAGEEDEGDPVEEEEEEEEGESRVTRSIKSMHHWRWNGRSGKGDRDWREITSEWGGKTLSLSSVRPSDSGKYACYHKGREMFSVRLIVADPPETPTLSCYKRSPSSKIRCEWTPQKAITVTPDCFLYLSKKLGRVSEPFRRLKCSFSLRLSRCWCALDHNEDQLRTLHIAFLCVSSITGNATSSLLHFRPLSILKPDPPSHVTVRQEVGQETKLKVSWSYPKSWKSQDGYYELTYELRYRPLKSSFSQEKIIKEDRTYTITDALPGDVYTIMLRTREEYDGVWSEWSSPVNATSWTAPSVSPFTTTAFPLYAEGSGSEEDLTDGTETVYAGPDQSHHILWISGSLILLSAVLAVYLFRYKDRFVSKLQSLSVTPKCRDSPQPQPSTLAAPEAQALVNSPPQYYKVPPPIEAVRQEEEDDDEEGEQANETMGALHFSNTSYFFLQK